MTLTELRYLVAVARERHFGRAADQCHVSQPTLSVAIKKLEDELGVLVFERGPHEVSLTPLGEQIVTQAKRTLEEADQIRQLAKAGKDQLHGSLRLGAIYTIGPYLLPHLIPKLLDQAPHMPLVIEENYTASLTEQLKRGALDVIVVALPFNEPGIVSTPLYEEPFVAVLPASHPWREHERIPLQDLGKETLLLLGAGHCFRDQVLSACPDCLHGGAGDNGLAKNLEGGSLETIRHMVASGMGITILPCTAAGADRYSQRLIVIRRFADPVPSRTVALAWRTSFPRPKAIDALRQAILECDLSCTQAVSNPGTLKKRT